MYEKQETAPSRVPMRTAVSEIHDHLQLIRRSLNELLEETLSDEDAVSEKCEERPFANNLESRIFDLFPIISAIDHSISRLRERIGVDPRANAPLPRADTNFRR